MSGYDPALLHYWTETKPRGEWTTVEIAPACSPNVRRMVRVGDPRPVTDYEAARCPDCDVISAAIGGA